MRGLRLFPARILPIWLVLIVAGCRSGAAKGSPENLLAEGKKALAADDLDRAQSMFRGVTERHENAPEAEEALVLLADTRRRAGEGDASRTSFESFARKYPNSPFSLQAAESEFQLGQDQFAGRMDGFLFFKADPGAGVRTMQHMQIHYKNHSLADDALVAVAQYRLSEREYDEAARTLRRLLSEYPRSEHGPWARYNLAYSLWLQNAGPVYDIRLLLQSRRAFEDFIGTTRQRGEAERFEERIAQARELIAKIDVRIAAYRYEVGRFYERTDHPVSAIYYYRLCARNLPASKPAQLARERIEALSAEHPDAARKAASALLDTGSEDGTSR